MSRWNTAVPQCTEITLRCRWPRLHLRSVLYRGKPHPIQAAVSAEIFTENNPAKRALVDLAAGLIANSVPIDGVGLKVISLRATGL
jgi:hypothetical protein